jgi:hypothetical protein
MGSGAMRWTQEMLDEFRLGTERRRQQIPVAVDRRKYGNVKVEVDGIKHDSTKEAGRWGELRQLERAGAIHDLKRQVSFVLAPAVRLAGEVKKKPAIRYFADFTYMRDGQLVVEDAKSKPTRKLAAYRMKKHLMKTVLNLDITEV